MELLEFINYIIETIITNSESGHAAFDSEIEMTLMYNGICNKDRDSKSSHNAYIGSYEVL